MDIDAHHLEVHEYRLRLRCHETFCSIPHLKHLIIRDCSQDLFEAFYVFNQSVLVEMETNQTLMNLEELTIILTKTWSICMINFFERLETLCAIRPKIKKLVVENMSEDNNDQLLEFRKNYPKLIINVSFVAKFSRIIRVYKINNYSVEDYEKIESCLGDKYFKFFWKNTIRLHVISITVSHIGMEKDWPTRYVVHMKELRELDIRSVKSSCFFGHEVAKNPSVRFLELHNCEEPCLECLRTIKLSFPNLKKLVHDCPSQDARFRMNVRFSERTTIVAYFDSFDD